MKKLSYGASAAVLLMAAASAVHAQETTGGISGTVTDTNGAPVANATVTVIHTPSGTSSTSMTDQTGSYNARNLRVGGPYTVTVSGSGVAGSQDVAAIGIGAPSNVDVVVYSDEGELEAVIVTASRTTRNTSPTANFNLSDIETLPSISRDIKDFVRTSPFATVDPSNNNALSIGGQNTRYNAFLVDGVRQSDDFGLNGNGYPTLGSPVSISVIEAVNVSVSPYDVQYGTFTGGVVNSVTKSGGNDFHGEAFYEFTNQGLQGNTFSYTDFQTGVVQNRSLTGTFEEKTYGATITGPIIQDRLFFLLNYEMFESTQPVLTGPTGSGAPNPVPGITQADVDNIRAITQTVYGFDPLDWNAGSIPIQDEKWFAKVDWNISDQHRAVFSYQQTEGGDFRSGPNATGGNYPALALLSSAYIIENNLKSYKAQVFSDWTDTFSTEFSVAKKEVEGITSNFVADNIASFQVYLDNPTGPQVGPERSIRFGPDRSRHANQLTVDTMLYRAVGNLDMDFGHRLTFGYEREEQDIFNLFIQVANAEYEFASIADFQNRIASSVGYANAATNIKADGAAQFSYALNSLFFQDTWQAMDNLTITAGLRIDAYEQDDVPKNNAAFQTRFGFSNQTNLDGISVVQPRFGFNWRANDDLTVYGGFGRYQGGSPNVWISNGFTNTGTSLGSYNCRVSTAYSSNFAGNFQVCPSGAYLTNVSATAVNPLVQAGNTTSANAGTGQINVLDPNFQAASIWKASLGANYDLDLSIIGLGEDWRLTAEYVHSELENPIGWVDLSMRQTQNGVAPDGRPVYGPNPVNPSQQVLMLTNYNGGYSDQFAIGISKDWYDGLLDGAGVSFTYTYLDSVDPSAGTSSTASSNYGNVATFAPNLSIEANSTYEQREAYKLNLKYDRAFFGDYKTRINLYGQRRSGLPFSYVFGTSPAGMFGETGSTQRQLLYVPKVDPTSGLVTATSDPLVRIGPAFPLAAFNAFLQNTGLIRDAGSITRRNSYFSPDVTTFDLHLAQELPAFFPGGARLEAYVDIENIGNLLNDEWGVIQQINFPGFSGNVGALNCQRQAGCAAGTGNFYQYNTFNNVSPVSFSGQSVWQAKFGVRYKF